MSVEIINEAQRSTGRLRLSTKIALRPFPYPYRAMLAICSDLDGTPDRRQYWQQLQFLNTRATTSMGEGLGLEVGNTIYFDMPPDEFAYWNTDDAGREMIRDLIRSGHIDCLHSYGDLATTRAHAAKVLNELSQHSLSLKVWIDHRVAPTNFGADIMRGHGDEVRHPAYHADLTLEYGIRYLWRGRVTSVIGQDQPTSLSGLWKRSRPALSGRTLLKEAVKQILGRAGHRKYSFHARNQTIAPAILRDGRGVTEFLRCNPHPFGVDVAATGCGIGEVLTPRFLDRLVQRNGSCILYTHLGKLGENGQRFNREAINAFRLLARYQQEGQILVTTTRRLLDFRYALQQVTCNASTQGKRTVVKLEAPLSRRELDGLTFYVAEPDNTEIRLNRTETVATVVNAPDESGRGSISIPWSSLTFPQL
jgi:hypothetical protein